MRSFFWLLSIALFFGCLSSYGQAPPGINYQAVARDKDGKALTSKDIAVRVSILHDSENGETEYSEKHSLKTNPFGLFMLVIGHGETIAGDFNFISWAVGNKWLKIELDPEGGNFFQLMGAQQLMSVPYAFYAKYAGNGYTAGPGISINNSMITNTGDADNNASNELISQLSFGADKKLSITEAGTTKEVDLSSLVGANQNLEQVLSEGNDAGGQVIGNVGAPTEANDAATKAYVDNHTDGDASDQNEIQDLTLNSNILKVTKKATATGIDLSTYLDNTDSQSLTLTGTNLGISGGNSVNLSSLAGADSQTLTLTGNSLTISGGNSIDISSLNTDQQNLALTTTGTQRTIDISNGTGITLDVADNDNSTTNELQDLSRSGNTLSLSNDATSVDLSSYLDNTDAQTLSTQSVDANTRSIAITGGNTLNVDVRDADASTTNEIQDLSRSGNTLSLSGDATTVDLSSYLDNTDNQDLTLTGNTLGLTNDATSVNLSAYLDNTDSQTLSSASVDANTRSLTISGGNTQNVDVRDADASTTNEIQDLSLTGNTLSLSSDATSVNLAPYLDNTDAQDLALTGNTLSLTNDATTINLAPYLDNTDAQNLSYNSGTKALSISGGNSVTISETQTLSQVLTQGANAGAQVITNLATPGADNDAATKKYVDDADAVLSSRISTTYAFKTAFAYTNTSGLIGNNQTLGFTTEDFDDFNVLGSNTFTATENGVYVFTVDGGHVSALPSGQLSILFNGTKYQVPVVQTSTGFRYNATQMFMLTVGQTVSLIGDSVLIGASFTGTFFGYKL